MADPPPRTPSPTEPAVFKAGERQTVSPYNKRYQGNLYPGKSGIVLKPNATYDRRLQGDSSMGTTVLVEYDDFVKDLLPPLPQDALAISEETLNNAKSALDTLFYGDAIPRKKVQPLEDPIAEAVVGLFNMVTLPHQHKAQLSRYKAQASDDSKFKVDAGLYLTDEAPSTESPDWTHCRVFIEFKGGKRQQDPWDDLSSQPESSAQERAKTRAQLISYAHKVFLYQHRTHLFSLVVFGNHFRAARWDRSGVIVSKKVDYLEDPKPLLQLVVRLVKLNDQEQGIDSTATLIPPDTTAYRIMDELAEPNIKEDMDYMEPGTEDYEPPPAPRGTATVATPSSGKASASNQPQTEDGAPEQSRPKATQATRSRAKKAAGRDTTEGHPQVAASAKPEAPDPDLSKMDAWKNEEKRVFRYVRDRFRESLVPDWPRYKLRIKYNGKIRVFLVAKPVFQSSSMFGRATRGYIAVDTTTGLFVFLKDSWRPFYEGVDPEGVYLEKFAGDPEIIVPQVICHGDVKNQCTKTARYVEKLKKMEADRRREQGDAVPSPPETAKQKANKKRSRPVDEPSDGSSQTSFAAGSELPDGKRTLRHHIHYRLAVQDVCLSFEEFRTSYQLVCLMLDCITTHYWVYTKHKLLHRDISSGNVLILPRLVTDSDGTQVVRWHGVLADWELAKPYLEDRLMEKARQPERTGTWQFMSVAYVMSQWTHPISVADELESFLHVTLFYAVRFLPNTIPNVAQFVKDYFDTFRTDDNNRRLCNEMKSSAVSKGFIGTNPSLEFLKTNGASGNPLNSLINELLALFMARYAILNHDFALSLAKQRAAPAGSDPKMATLIEHRPTLDGKSWRVSRGQLPVSNVEPTGPDKTTRDLAANLDTHVFVMNLFADIKDLTPKGNWYDTWVVQDQLVGYEPRIILMEHAISTIDSGLRETDESSSKRARTTTSTLASSASSSQQPPASSSGVGLRLRPQYRT